MPRKTTVWYVALKNADGRRKVVEVTAMHKDTAERLALTNQFDINDGHCAHWQILESTAVRNIYSGAE